MSDGMERLATGEYARAVESKQADAFRLGSRPTDQQVDEANWLIDRMSSRVEELEAKLAKATAALERCSDYSWARDTLAELKGETDD